MSTKDLSAVPVLAKDNYQTWAWKIDGYFRLNGLYSLVHGTSLRPADTEADAQLKWDDRQMQAAGAITMSIDDSNAVHVRGKEGDPVEMWTKLDSIHNSKSASTRFNAMDSLFSIAKENNENLASMMTRIAAVMQRVQALRPTDSTEAYSLNTLDDELVIMAMLRGLPDDYQHLRSSLLCQQKLTRTMVEQAFVAEDNHRHHHERNQAIALRASTHQPYTHPRTNRHKPTAADRTPGATCGYCGKRNHTEAQCFAKADATHHKAHAAANIANATNEVPNAMAANASSSPLPAEAKSDLNADTGATRTMMNDASFFTELHPLVRTIRIADGKNIFSKGEGDVVFQPWLDNHFSPHVITFPNVLFAPDLQSNLIAVLRMVKKEGYEVRIKHEQMEFYFDGKLRMTARIDDNCVAYLDGRVLPPESSNVASTLPLDRSLWHRRLGHYHHDGIDALIRHNLVNGLKIESASTPDPICAPCISGKQTRAPHTTPATRATIPLQRVFIDLKGPINVESMPHRAKYWMPMVDDASNFVTLSLLRSKDMALDAFRSFHRLAENQTSRKLIHLRDDKGGEFSGHQFDQYCADSGITRERTIIATPEQNGRVERVNRWIAEGAIAKLTEANLPPSFWGLAALACVHEFNRARIHNGKTPYEHWYGKTPGVDHLRVFGCLAYVFVPRGQRGTLDSHTQRCIFVGYPSDRPGWVFWDPSTRKIVHSDSAVFDERVFPGTSLAKESTPNLENYVQLPELPSENNEVNDPKENDVPKGVQPDAIHPPVLVAGVPVPVPAPEAAAAAPAPPPEAPHRMSRELRALTDTANFEAFPKNVPKTRRSTARRPGALTEPNSDDDVAACQITVEGTPHGPVPPHVQPRNQWEKTCQWKTTPKPETPEYILIPAVDGVEAALNTSTTPGEPTTLAEALQRPDGDKYLGAAIEEVKAHLENKTWQLALLPEGKKAIGSRWVFKIKRDENGSISKYKGRIVAKGYAQREGIDYTETFAPTARFGALRTVIALAALEDWELESVDISTAFLNGDIDAEVYMKKPEGVEFKGYEGHEWVLQLLKGLYGIKQGPRIWSVKLHNVLVEIGFQRLDTDHSVFTYERDGVKIIIPVHVDDLLLASSSKEAIEKVKDELKTRFKIHDQGPTSFLLGVKLERDRTKRTISLSQPAYIEQILEIYGMQDCNEADTPMAEKPPLSAKDSPQTEEERKKMANTPYREALGKLIYLATATRPDISYAVGVLCRYSENPGIKHWSALKRVLRYLRKTTNYRLTYGLPTDSNELFITHSDADLGGNVDNSRSTAGFVLSIGGGAVMWSSRLQRHTSLSSTESEYTTASATGCEMIWMRELLDEIGYDLSAPSTLYVDNNSAIQVAKNPEHQSTMKHVHRSFHWIREKVANKEIRVTHVPGTENVADIFTKPLGRLKFQYFIKKLGLVPHRRSPT